MIHALLIAIADRPVWLLAYVIHFHAIPGVDLLLGA